MTIFLETNLVHNFFWSVEFNIHLLLKKLLSYMYVAICDNMAVNIYKLLHLVCNSIIGKFE